MSEVKTEAPTPENPPESPPEPEVTPEPTEDTPPDAPEAEPEAVDDVVDPWEALADMQKRQERHAQTMARLQAALEAQKDDESEAAKRTRESFDEMERLRQEAQDMRNRAVQAENLRQEERLTFRVMTTLGMDDWRFARMALGEVRNMAEEEGLDLSEDRVFDQLCQKWAQNPRNKPLIGWSGDFAGPQRYTPGAKRRY